MNWDFWSVRNLNTDYIVTQTYYLVDQTRPKNSDICHSRTVLWYFTSLDEVLFKIDLNQLLEQQKNSLVQAVREIFQTSAAKSNSAATEARMVRKSEACQSESIPSATAHEENIYLEKKKPKCAPTKWTTLPPLSKAQTLGPDYASLSYKLQVSLYLVNNNALSFVQIYFTVFTDTR